MFTKEVLQTSPSLTRFCLLVSTIFFLTSERFWHHLRGAPYRSRLMKQDYSIRIAFPDLAQSYWAMIFDFMKLPQPSEWKGIEFYQLS